MPISAPSSLPVWHLLTRLGEAQILLPAALLAALALLRRAEARPLLARWVALLGAATLVTIATKVAFIGWGIGWAEVNFTGVSGHAMFAAAVYPLLLGVLASGAPRSGRLFAIFAASMLALLVGVSRVVVGAHSVSEVIAGLLVGGGVSAGALAIVRLPPRLIGRAIPAVVALWLMVMPAHAPASRSHSVVTKLSLLVSGHKVPYTRSDMLHKLRPRQAMSCEPRPRPETFAA